MAIVVSCVRGWAIAHVAWVRLLDNVERGVAELEGWRTQFDTLQRGMASQLDALQRRMEELQARVQWLQTRLAERATRFESDHRSLRVDVDELLELHHGLSHRVDALHIQYMRMHAGQSESGLEP